MIPQKHERPAALPMRDVLLSLLARHQGEAALADQDFRAASSRYPELRATTLAKVHRWEWCSSNPRYEPDPFHFLNPTARRGRVARREPSVKDNKHQYGIDASGRIIARRQHTDSPQQFYEEFFERETGSVRSTLFDYGDDKRPLNCTRISLVDGSPRARHRVARHGSASDVYVTERGRIRFRCWQVAPQGRDPWGACEELVFTREGVVELWQLHSPQERILIFSGDPSLYDTMRLCA